MFRHYTHGHSIVLGALGGLLLAQHVLWIASVCLLAGFLAGRLYNGLLGIGQVLLARLNPVKARVHRRVGVDSRGVPWDE